MNSIIQKNKECFICKNPYTEEHHVFFGNGRRKLSTQFGMLVYLCPEHHRGNLGAHNFRPLDLMIKQEAQKIWEKEYGTRQDFISCYGKSYL